MPTLSADTDTGISNSDAITNAAPNGTLTFSGSGAIEGSTVWVFLDLDRNGTFDISSDPYNMTANPVGSSGAWSNVSFNVWGPPTVPDGTYCVYAFVITQPAGVRGALSVPLSVTIDHTGPTVSRVTSSDLDGIYRVGHTLSIEVQFNENVIVTGTPTLTLETGTTDRVINYTPGPGTNVLTFSYTVQAGEASIDLNYAATNSLRLNGGTITDVAGNNATPTLPAPGSANSLAGNKAIALADETAPTVVSINRVGAAATNASSASFTVMFSEAVTGVDLSDFVLALGGTASGTVSALTGSGASYTVTLSALKGDGTLRLDLSGAVTGIADAAANPIAGGFTNGQSYTLDHTPPSAPTFTGIADDNGPWGNDAVTNDTKLRFSGTAENGSVVNVTRIAPTPVQLVFTATATLAGWTSNYPGTYSPALASAKYTFTATATDAAGNVSPASAGFTVEIDTTAPTVVGVSSSAPDGIYKIGDQIPIAVKFSEPVAVTGTPQLAMATGTPNRSVNYSSGSGTDTLTFLYTVQSGDVSGDLATNSLTLNGGKITDPAGNNATLTLPGPTSANSLAGSKALVIDGVVPTTTVETVVFSADTGRSATDLITATAAQTISGTLSAPLAAGEVVQVSLDDGGSWTAATIAAGASAWSLAAQTLVASTTIRVRVADAAGNLGAVFSRPYILDATPPATPPAPATALIVTTNPRPPITGTAEPGSNVELHDGATLIGTATAAAGTGAWSITPSIDLGVGTHALSAAATDVAGNTSGASPVLSLRIESDGPSPSLSSQTITFGLLADRTTTGERFVLNAAASSGLAVQFTVVSGPATISGNRVTLTGMPGVVTIRATQTGDSEYEEASPVERSFRVKAAAPPSVHPPKSGAQALLSAACTGPGCRYQWQCNGADLSGETGPTLALANCQAAKAGLYTYKLVSPDGSGHVSDPVILGLSTAEKMEGAAEEVLTDVLHPNGNVYDQLLLGGEAAALTANAGQVTRISFIDLSDDIVQVEFSGAGTLSLVVDGGTAAAPAPAVNYNQPGVNYVRGHASIVITGANETSNVSVFSVGRITAVD